MKKYKYYARSGAPFKKEHAQDIGEFIAHIDKITPSAVLKEVQKKPHHVLYNYLEWDDKKAGKQYRLQQVRNIVNHVEVKIIDNGESEPLRAFYSIVDDEEDSLDIGRRCYVSAETAFSDVDKKRQVISRAKAELKNWRDRYKIYRELSDVVSALEPYLE